MSTPAGPDIHANFLRLEKAFIAECNDGYGGGAARLKLKSLKKLEERALKLELVQERASGFKARAKSFVESAFWDEKRHGKFDPAKEVMGKVYGGAVKKGIWIFTGREGEHEFEETDKTLVREVTVEEEGAGVIVAAAVETKSAVILDGMASASKEREANAVSAPPMDFQELLALAGFTASGQKEEDKQEDVAEGEVVVTVEDEDGDQEDMDDSEPDDDAELDCDDTEQGRLSGYFAASGSTHTASGQASSSSGQASMPLVGAARAKVKSKGQGKGSQAPTIAKAMPKPSGKGKVLKHNLKRNALPQIALALDGRGLRIQATIKTMLEEEEGKLKALVFDEDHEGVCMLGEAHAEFNAQVVDKGRRLATSRSALKVMKNRIDNSKNATTLKIESEALDEISSRIGTLADFVDLVIKPCRDLEQALSTTKAFCNKIPRSDCKTPGCPSSAGRQNYRNAIQDSTAGLQDTRTTWFLGYIYIYIHIYIIIYGLYIYISIS